MACFPELAVKGFEIYIMLNMYIKYTYMSIKKMLNLVTGLGFFHEMIYCLNDFFKI